MSATSIELSRTLYDHYYISEEWNQCRWWTKVKLRAWFCMSQRGGQMFASPGPGVRPTRHARPYQNGRRLHNSVTKIKQILTPVETVLVPLCFPEIRTESSFVQMSYSGRHLSPEWRECSNSFLRTQNKLVSVMLAACPITANNGIW